MQSERLDFRVTAHADSHFAGFEVVGGLHIQDRDILHTRIAQLEQDRGAERFQDGSVYFGNPA